MTTNASSGDSSWPNTHSFIPLEPFMRDVRCQVGEIVQECKHVTKNIYISILEDFLRCCALLSLAQQKTIVETILASYMLKKQSTNLAKVDVEDERIELIARLCGIRPSRGFFLGNSPGQICKALHKHSQIVGNAYLYGKRTFKLLDFFEEGFVRSENLMTRFVALDRFAHQERLLNYPAQQKRKMEDFAFGLAVFMQRLEVSESIEENTLMDILKSSDLYDFLFKEWVESPLFHTVYLKATRLFDSRLDETAFGDLEAPKGVPSAARCHLMLVKPKHLKNYVQKTNCE